MAASIHREEVSVRHLLDEYSSFYIRRLIGYRVWRTLHFVTFAAFLSALAHGIGAGADTSSVWAQEIYILTGIALGGLALLRLFNRSSRGLAARASISTELD